MYPVELVGILRAGHSGIHPHSAMNDGDGLNDEARKSVVRLLHMPRGEHSSQGLSEHVVVILILTCARKLFNSSLNSYSI
jgi:hypothetical protein